MEDFGYYFYKTVYPLLKKNKQTLYQQMIKDESKERNKKQ